MNDERLNKIIEILVDEFKPERIILFGSRGKKIHQPNSDYDLAVETNNIEFRKKRIVKERINKIIGLHKFDLVFLNEVDVNFRKIIINSGKVIYERRA
jgi:predicted nucleotidyltransferase